MKQSLTFLLSLICTVAFSFQESFERKVRETLEDYFDYNPSFSISISFHQPAYVPGDTAFFSIRLTHPNDPSYQTREIVTLELTDASGKIVCQQKVLVEGGVSANQIILPQRLNGSHQLALYTQGSDQSRFCLLRQPFVVDGTAQMSLSKALGIFPEGGQLIRDVVNTVLITGPPEKNLFIVSNSGDSIASVSLDQRGSKVISFTPKGTTQYNLVYQDHSTAFPESVDGVAMTMTIPGEGFPLRLILQVPDSSKHFSDSLFLAITGNNILHYFSPVAFTDKKNILLIRIPSDQLPDGVLSATLFERNGNVVAERSFSIKAESVKVNIELNKATFNIRDAVVAKIKLPPGIPVERSGSLSCTIFNADLFRSDGFDVGYPAGRESDNFNNDLIARSIRYDFWKHVFQSQKRQAFHSPYLRLSGVVLENGKPVPDSSRIDFLLQHNAFSYQAYTVNGRFDIPMLFYFEGIDEVLYRVSYHNKPLKGAVVMLNEDQHPTLEDNVTPILPRDTPYRQFVSKKRSIERAYKAALTSISDSLQSKSLIEEELTAPDLIVNLDHYLIFPSMSETLREIVPLVQHRTRNQRNIIKVFFDQEKKFGDGDPLYVIDGVVTDDTDYFLSLDPADVQKIKVFNNRDNLQAIGPIGKDGVIVVDTKIQGNAKNVRRSVQSFKTIGLNPSLTFLRSSSLNSRIPDLDITLHWNPKLKLNSKGEAVLNFHTSDVTGNYSVEIRGMLQDGTPIFGSAMFSVQYVP